MQSLKKSVTFAEDAAIPRKKTLTAEWGSLPTQIIHVPKKTLRLTVHSLATNYEVKIAGLSLDTPDPCIRVDFMGRSSFTPQVENNPTPSFEEQFSYILPAQYEKKPMPLAFHVVDSNMLFNSDKGGRQIDLNTLLRLPTDPDGLVPLDVYSAKSKTKAEEDFTKADSIGTLYVSAVVEDIAPAESLESKHPPDVQGFDLEDNQADFRSRDGFLKVEAYHIEAPLFGKDVKSKFEMNVRAGNEKDSKFDVKTLHVNEVSGQIQKTAYLRFDSIWTTVLRLQLMEDDRQGGEVVLPLRNVMDLVEGMRRVVVCEMEISGQSASAKVLAALSLHNSIFTRKKIGRLELAIDWDEKLATEALVEGKGKVELAYKYGNATTVVKPGATERIDVQAGRSSILFDIKVEQTTMLSNFFSTGGLQSVTEGDGYEFHFAEIFGNEKYPCWRRFDAEHGWLKTDRLARTGFQLRELGIVTKNGTALVKLKMAAKFIPDPSTYNAEEKALWDRYLALWEAGQLPPREEMAPHEQSKEVEDYPANDFFNLNLDPPIHFQESPIGLLVIQPDLKFRLREEIDLQLVFSTAHELYASTVNVFDEVVKIRTLRAVDVLYMRIVHVQGADNSKVVAEGKLSLAQAMQHGSAYRKLSLPLELTHVSEDFEDGNLECSLNAQYRSGDLLAIEPEGRWATLSLTLLSLQSVQHAFTSIEISVGDQKATFRADDKFVHRSSSNEYSIQDTRAEALKVGYRDILEIAVYEARGLLYSESRDVSTLVLRADNSKDNGMAVNLRFGGPNLDGTIEFGLSLRKDEVSYSQVSDTFIQLRDKLLDQQGSRSAVGVAGLHRKDTFAQRFQYDDDWPQKQLAVVARVQDITASNSDGKSKALMVRIGYAKQAFQTHTVLMRTRTATIGEQGMFWLKDIGQKMEDNECKLTDDWSFVCSLIEVDALNGNRVLGSQYFNGAQVRILQNARQYARFVIVGPAEGKKRGQEYSINVAFFSSSAKLLRNPIALMTVSDVRMSKKGKLQISHNASQLTVQSSSQAGMTLPSFLLMGDFYKMMAMGQTHKADVAEFQCAETATFLTSKPSEALTLTAFSHNASQSFSVPVGLLAILLEANQKLPITCRIGDVTASMTIQVLYDTVPVGSLQEMKVVKSAFQLPAVISYRDYISKGYDDVMEKQREARRKQKAEKLREKNAAIFSRVDQSKLPKHAKKEEAPSSTRLVTFRLSELLGPAASNGEARLIIVEPCLSIEQSPLHDYLRATENSKDLAGQDDELRKRKRYEYMIGQVGKHIESMIVKVESMVTVQAGEATTLWLRSDIKAAVVTVVSGSAAKVRSVKEAVEAARLSEQFTALYVIQKLQSGCKVAHAELTFDKGIEMGPQTAITNAKKHSNMPQVHNLSIGTLVQSKPTDQVRTMLKDAAATASVVAVARSSEFVDCPSAEIDLMIKQLSTHNETILSKDHFLRVELLSAIRSDEILFDDVTKTRKDVGQSQPLTHYSKRTPKIAMAHEAKEPSLILALNHVTNLAARHYNDRVRISVMHAPGYDATKTKDGTVLASTELPLSELNLKEEHVLSFVGFLTGLGPEPAQNFYRLEFDISYKALGQHNAATSALELAIKNYKLMMGRDEITEIERQILIMLIERQELSVRLNKPGVLPMRRAGFLFRHMVKLQYTELDTGRRLRLLVSPMNFLYQVFAPGKLFGTGGSYDHYRVLDERRKVERELRRFDPQVLEDALGQAAAKVKSQKSDAMTPRIEFGEGNLLQIRIDESGIDLEKFGVKSSSQPLKLRKLIFQVQLHNRADVRQGFKQVFGQGLLLSNDKLLSNTLISIPNVQAATEVKFSLQCVLDSSSNSSAPDAVKSYGPSGSMFIAEFASKIRNNEPIKHKVSLCKSELKFEFAVVQNTLTRVPHRVLEVGFHRMVQLSGDNDFMPEDPSSPANNVNLYLAETRVCIQKKHPIVRVADLVEGGASLADETTGGDKKNQIHKGSVLDLVQRQIAAEMRANRAETYDLFVDFDTSEPYLGEHGASHKISVNKFGKNTQRGLSKFEINNTSAANKIEFKVFRSGTRKADRLRKLGIGLEPKNTATQQHESEFGLLATAEISLANLKNFTINKPMALLIPINKAQPSEMDPKRDEYVVKDVYALLTLCVTDKTFGELIVDINELRGLPECKMIREVQHRVQVVPTEENVAANAGDKLALLKNTKGEKSELDDAGVARIEPIFSYLSHRVPYEITQTASMAVTRELVVGLKLRNILSQKRLLLSDQACDIFADQDQRIFIDVFCIDKLNQKHLACQLKRSLIEIIRDQMGADQQRAVEERRQRLMAQREREMAGKFDAMSTSAESEALSGRAAALEQAQQRAAARIQSERQEVMEHRRKMRKLRKEGAMQADIAELDRQFEADLERRRLAAEAREAAGEEESKRSEQNEEDDEEEQKQFEQLPMPEGQGEILLPNSEDLVSANPDEKTDFIVGGDRPKELQRHPGVRLVGSVRWSFSYQKRELKDDAYYSRLQDMQELQRTQQKKRIPNIIRTLQKLKGDKDLLNRTMDLLTLVLATESCGGGLDGEQPEDMSEHELIANMPLLLTTFKNMFIAFNEDLPITSTIALMKSCLYMKIVASVSGEEYLKQFTEHFEKCGIFELVHNLFEAEMKKEAGSKLLCTKVLNFVTFMIYDLPRLYFDNISGLRLKSLIGYHGSTEDRKKDADIVRAHTKFVNACCQCLFEWGRPGAEAPPAKEEPVVKHDIAALADITAGAMRFLVDGGMNTRYKSEYEQIAGPLAESAIRFVHLCVSKFDMLKDEDEASKSALRLLSETFGALFTFLVDSIASKLSPEFVDKLKEQLTYEIALINQLQIRSALKLFFKASWMGSLLSKLCEVYLNNLAEQHAQTPDSEEFVIDISTYYEKMRVVMEFFASSERDPNLARTIIANNKANVKKILTDPTIERVDFVIWLSAASKAAMLEEADDQSVEGEDKDARARRLYREQFGGATKFNRFSISYIEWLEEEMPDLLDF